MGKRDDRVKRIVQNRPRPLRALRNWVQKPKGKPREKARRYKAAKRFAKRKSARVRGSARKVWERRRARWRKKQRFFTVRADKPRASLPKVGTSIFDGKVVPNWIVNHLKKARASGEWQGVVISGVRTPAYSVQLCHNICGAPRCPGLCAGMNSNHNATEPVEDGEGAIDVSDHVGLGRWMNVNGNPLRNDRLPNDRNHFSQDGQ